MYRTPGIGAGEVPEAEASAIPRAMGVLFSLESKAGFCPCQPGQTGRRESKPLEIWGSEEIKDHFKDSQGDLHWESCPERKSVGIAHLGRLSGRELNQRLRERQVVN